MAAPTRPGRRGPPGGRGRRLDHAPSARDTPSRRPQNAQTQGHGEKQAARWGQDLDAPPWAEKTDGRARADPKSSADGRPARPVGAHAAPSTAGNRHDGPRAAPRNTFQKFKWIEVTHSVPLDLNRIKNPMGRYLGKTSSTSGTTRSRETCRKGSGFNNNEELHSNRHLRFKLLTLEMQKRKGVMNSKNQQNRTDKPKFNKATIWFLENSKTDTRLARPINRTRQKTAPGTSRRDRPGPVLAADPTGARKVGGDGRLGAKRRRLNGQDPGRRTESRQRREQKT